MDFTRFKPETIAAIGPEAQLSAKNLDHKSVGAVDVFLGIMAQQDSVAQVGSVEKIMLIHFNITPRKLHNAAFSTVTLVPKATNVTALPELDPSGEWGYRDNVVKAFKLANSYAEESGSLYSVTRPDIALALIEGGDPSLLHVLRSVNVRLGRLKEVMQKASGLL